MSTPTVANTRYDTVLNRSYQELAEHYGTAIVPARVRKPQDKSHAESSVRFAETWIIASLRDQKFFSISEVRAAVRQKLEELNDRKFKQRAGSRRSAYLEEEKEYMLPLSVGDFEPAVWSVAKVGTDYLVSDGRNKYSVSSTLIGESVDIRTTSQIVEVFFHGSRVAAHRRFQTKQYDPIIKLEHLTPEHRKYLNYNAEHFTQWAETVGPMAAKVIRCFPTSGRAPEQGYKSCVSLMKLAERYSVGRLESACELLLSYSSTPSVRNISSMLKNGQDKVVARKEGPAASNSYGITRGAAYFRKGGEHK